MNKTYLNKQVIKATIKNGLSALSQRVAMSMPPAKTPKDLLIQTGLVFGLNQIAYFLREKE